jgi:hypothetical protein
MLKLLSATAGLSLILVVLADGFAATVMPRRVTNPYTPTRLFYQLTWRVWRLVARWMTGAKRRMAFLGVFGPLSMLGLFAVWVACLIVGFALFHWGLTTPVTPGLPESLETYLYFSGTTFFTLGYGDVTPTASFGRFLSVIEAGLGFGFLAVIVGYLPVLSQAFSRRELTISLLDARGGSPPTAGELLLRGARSGHISGADAFLAEWERWASELLESQLSFPVLAYYRSQHDNQSWLAALTAVLDVSAFTITNVDGLNRFQAELTFAMSRHAAVDLGLVFRRRPIKPPERLPSELFQRLRRDLAAAGLRMREGEGLERKLAELRAMYEPFVYALADLLLLDIPPFVAEKPPVDNWQTSAWTPRVGGLGTLRFLANDDEHFR